LSPHDGFTARHPAQAGALLELCEIGEPSRALTAQWARLRADLLRLLDDGRIVP
jgi:hypothetical protein